MVTVVTVVGTGWVTPPVVLPVVGLVAPPVVVAVVVLVRVRVRVWVPVAARLPSTPRRSTPHTLQPQLTRQGRERGMEVVVVVVVVVMEVVVVVEVRHGGSRHACRAVACPPPTMC